LSLGNVQNTIWMNLSSNRHIHDKLYEVFSHLYS
jgi:hypothetical protein